MGLGKVNRMGQCRTPSEVPYRTSYRNRYVSWDVKGGQDLEIEVGIRVG